MGLWFGGSYWHDKNVRRAGIAAFIKHVPFYMFRSFASRIVSHQVAAKTDDSSVKDT